MNLISTGNASPAWSTPKLYPRSDGDQVTDFAETFLHVSKGVLAGERLRLTDWQKELLVRCMSVVMMGCFGTVVACWFGSQEWQVADWLRVCALRFD
jgi:hypothetical protein